MKRVLVIASLFLSLLLVAPAFAYTGSVDFPELFKYSDQKDANLETALHSISSSLNDKGVPVTQELIAAIMATLDKEVGSNYLPIEENGDYGMGTNCTYKIDGSCRSTSYDSGVDYKGRGYIQITGKNNYQAYCGSDCVGTSTPELDVCGCKNQWDCTVTDVAVCPQIKALQPDYAARIFALYYVNNNLVSLSNAKSYRDVGKAINGGEAYASDFSNIANAYLTLFSDNPDKTSSLLTWLNSGTSAAAANIPPTVHECETHGFTFCGTWKLEDNCFKATWINGAVATLTVDHWGPADVVVSRIDPSGVSAGLSARYEGQIDGNKIENGKVTWTWLGFTWSGTWNANW